MTETTRRTGWFVIATLATLAAVEPMNQLLNSAPSEGPFPFCEAIATSAIGIGWWIASRKRQTTTE